MNNPMNLPGNLTTPDFSAPNNQHLYIRDSIASIYWIYINRHDTVFFVYKATMQATSPDSPRAIKLIKSYFSFDLNQKVSTSAIQEAIAVLKGFNDPIPFFHPSYIRVVDNGSTLFLQQSSMKFWCISGHDTELRSLPQNANLNSPHLGHKPEFKMPPPTPYIWSANLKDLPDDVNLNAQALEKLFSITPLPKDQDLLVLAWLVLTLLPRFEQTALQITGEAQSGKTWTQKLLTSLVDPQYQIIINPSKKNDIQESLIDCYILSLDDVESLNTDAQALLRECLTTHVHRYPPRSKDPMRIDLRKPVILNSLEPIIKNKELRKRTINIDIEPDEDIDFNSVTDQNRSEIFGGLLHLTSHVLGHLSGPWYIDGIPSELNDYCHVGYKVAQILEGSPQRFIDQFHDHQRQKEREQIEENDVAIAIEKWIQVNPEGDKQKVSDWSRTLKPYNPDALNWPQSGRAMSAQLSKAKNPLKRAGIHVTPEGKQSRYGYWTIRKKE